MNERDLIASAAHRPWPMPAGKPALSMRWTDLLFAHWPIPAPEISQLLPAGFAVDVYDDMAWVGVVPFRMERVKLRGLPMVPGSHLFPEANVRTYVRDEASGQPGVYFFSLDASNPLAVVAARSWYRLPYYLAKMSVQTQNGWLDYSSKRLFSSVPAELRVRYCGAGQQQRFAPSKPGSIEHFLTERYALFTNSPKRLIRADIHHLPWTLEPAEAHFKDLSIAAAQSVRLPPSEPLLHYSRLLDVLAWPPKAIRRR